MSAQGDDEDKKIQKLAIANASLFSGDLDQNSTHFRRSQAGAATLKHSVTRTCRICHKPGHGLRRCPKLLGPRGNRKIRNAAGMPRSKLKQISVKDLDLDDSIGDIYSLADGSLFVLASEKPLSSVVLSSAQLRQRIMAYFVPMKSQPGLGCESISGPFDEPSVFYSEESLRQLEESYKCPLCKCLINNPRAVTCCGTTYCHLCIRANLGKYHHHCPSCDALIDAKRHLVINSVINATIMGLKNALSGGQINSGTTGSLGGGVNGGVGGPFSTGMQGPIKQDTSIPALTFLSGNSTERKSMRHDEKNPLVLTPADRVGPYTTSDFTANAPQPSTLGGPIRLSSIKTSGRRRIGGWN